MISRSLRKPH